MCSLRSRALWILLISMERGKENNVHSWQTETLPAHSVFFSKGWESKYLLSCTFYRKTFPRLLFFGDFCFLFVFRFLALLSPTVEVSLNRRGDDDLREDRQVSLFKYFKLHCRFQFLRLLHRIPFELSSTFRLKRKLPLSRSNYHK